MIDVFSELIFDNKVNNSSSSTTMNLVTAIVKENWNDEYKGYVKVEYILGEEGQKTSDWVRVLQSYAGNQYGSYIIPEIGSEVLVGFIKGDFDNPVIIGCLYNPENQIQSELPNKDNSIKSFKTKGGHEVVFSEEKNKEKITVNTPAKLSVTLDDENKKIELKDSSNENSVLIDSKGGNVSINAKSKIELSCGNSKIEIDANSIKITAGTVEINAKQTFNTSSQSMKMEATSVEVKSKGSLNVQSSGIAQIKGSLIKLN